MYIVTGGAGFIGSHIVRALNDRGITEILVVDDLSRGEKFFNLNDCTIFDFMGIGEFEKELDRGGPAGKITAILHQGACTDTMEFDGEYMMRVNFTFSKKVLTLALKKKAPMVYASSASVYGANDTFVESPENELPINVYAYSKLAFDQHLRRLMPDIKSTVVGLRYFNVYGPREQFKDKMASMVYQLYLQLKQTGKAKLFEGTGGYGDGEQRRDFVYVGDAVKVNLHFAEQKNSKGIFNVGTGESRSFNAIARTLIKLLGSGEIEYIPFNTALEGKYQSFTEADITALREAGFSRPFTSLEDGIAKCFQEWEGRNLSPAVNGGKS